MEILKKEDALLDLLLSERNGWECEGHRSLCFSYHEIVELKIQREVSKINNKISNMEFRRAET